MKLTKEMVEKGLEAACDTIQKTMDFTVRAKQLNAGGMEAAGLFGRRHTRYHRINKTQHGRMS